jgi:hypothetical protein
LNFAIIDELSGSVMKVGYLSIKSCAFCRFLPNQRFYALTVN